VNEPDSPILNSADDGERDVNVDFASDEV